MDKITASQARPGDTIKAAGPSYPEPVTLTVLLGGWVDIDRFGNWIEPVDPEHPTHVYLDGGGEFDVILLPVDEEVWLVERTEQTA